MLLKTSINVLSKNEGNKKPAGRTVDLTLPLLTSPSNTYLYYQDLSSKFDLGLASEFVQGRERTGVI